MAAKKGREYRSAAGVADCGRSQKWGNGGGSRLGFQLKAGHHKGWGANARPGGKKRGERTLATGAWGGARGFGLRTGDLSSLLMVLGTAGELPGWAGITGRNWESGPAMDFYFLSWDTGPDWPGLARGGRTVCVFVGVLKGLWDLMVTFHYYSKPV